MRVILLVNESSGSASGPSGAEVAAAMAAVGATVQRLPIGDERRAVAAGPDRLVVAGGDGSVAPAADAAGAAGLTLAVVPCGTANDFARRMGLPSDPLTAARLAVTGHATRVLDLGRMGDRPFVNVATAGLSVLAARGARPLKPALGAAAYAAGAVRSALTGRPVPCEVRCDGRPVHAGPAWQVMVACSGAFGGGSRVAGADAADGLLDVVALAAGPRARLVRHARALRSGRITDQPGVRADRGGEVSLGLPEGQELNVDGELCGAGDAFRVEPGRFRLVVP